MRRRLCFGGLKKRSGKHEFHTGGTKTGRAMEGETITFCSRFYPVTPEQTSAYFTFINICPAPVLYIPCNYEYLCLWHNICRNVENEGIMKCIIKN